MKKLAIALLSLSLSFASISATEPVAPQPCQKGLKKFYVVYRGIGAKSYAGPFGIYYCGSPETNSTEEGIHAVEKYLVEFATPKPESVLVLSIQPLTK